MSFGNPTFVQFIVMRSSRLPLSGLRSRAGRPRYIQKSKSKLLLVSIAEQLRQEGLEASKQQGIVEALEIRFGMVPQGLREGIQTIGDPVKLTGLLRAAIRSGDIEAFAREL